MKKLFHILILAVFIVGCESVTLRGRHGGIRMSKRHPHRRAWIDGGVKYRQKHKKHTNIYYNVRVDSGVYLEF